MRLNFYGMKPCDTRSPARTSSLCLPRDERRGKIRREENQRAFFRLYCTLFSVVRYIPEANILHIVRVLKRGIFRTQLAKGFHLFSSSFSFFVQHWFVKAIQVGEAYLREQPFKKVRDLFICATQFLLLSIGLIVILRSTVYVLPF